MKSPGGSTNVTRRSTPALPDDGPIEELWDFDEEDDEALEKLLSQEPKNKNLPDTVPLKETSLIPGPLHIYFPSSIMAPGDEAHGDPASKPPAFNWNNFFLHCFGGLLGVLNSKQRHQQQSQQNNRLPSTGTASFITASENCSGSSTANNATNSNRSNLVPNDNLESFKSQAKCLAAFETSETLCASTIMASRDGSPQQANRL
ncbi:hypothetical protein HDV63DRAFT_390821 [Trichoderma sp. SZMC 28014]